MKDLKQLKVRVKVVPNASCDQIVAWLGNALKVKVRAVAEGGKANKAVIELLADQLEIAKAQIQITSGLTQANKVVILQGISQPQLEALLPSND